VIKYCHEEWYLLARIGELRTTLAATSNWRTLLVADSVVPSSRILVTLMTGALGSSETSVLTRATRRDIPEDTFLHSHRRENLKSLILPCVWVTIDRVLMVIGFIGLLNLLLQVTIEHPLVHRLQCTRANT
jgi:hypothetical protein